MAEPNNISVHQDDKKVIPYDQKGPIKTEQELTTRKVTEREDTPIKHGVIDKILGHPEQGPAISGAIFAMTSLSIGTGCLTFTKKTIEFGFVWFGVFLIIGGIATYWTLVGLIRVAKKEGDMEYSSTVRKILGKCPAVLIDVMAGLYSWGIIITY